MISVAEAYAELQKEIKNDPAYAWAWHCQIAMAAQDIKAKVGHKTANQIATRAMEYMFQVTTKEPPRNE